MGLGKLLAEARAIEHAERDAFKIQDWAGRKVSELPIRDWKKSERNQAWVKLDKSPYQPNLPERYSLLNDLYSFNGRVEVSVTDPAISENQARKITYDEVKDYIVVEVRA